MPKIEVLYEDHDLMVINKPAGVVVNRSETATETVQDWLVGYLRLSGNEGELMRSRSGLAHRLDKETSGCLLIGKREDVLVGLMSQFKNREVEKEYLALVHGWVDPRRGAVSLPIARDRLKREKRAVRYDGKRAETSWKVQSYYRDGEDKYSLVKLMPKTGRTHQIRVHMAHLGHPLFADSMYLRAKRARLDRKRLARHFLHAEKITFQHPLLGKKVKVLARLTADLEMLLSSFDMV